MPDGSVLESPQYSNPLFVDPVTGESPAASEHGYANEDDIDAAVDMSKLYAQLTK